MPFDQYLTVTNHNRTLSGMKYIYPVVSRRAGGVSIGINLNVNNACNWHCIYCQVPNLKRGLPPSVDLMLLEQELRAFLNEVVHGDFMERYVAKGDRHLKDVAFSGNGEPTSAKAFPQALRIVERILREFDLLNNDSNNAIKIRLITNGSLVDQPPILAAIRHLATCNGEVWFKLDSGIKAGFDNINHVNINPLSHIKRLKKCAQVCPTYVQTCMFSLDGMLPNERDLSDYLMLIEKVKSLVQGVHLYNVARPSLQAESTRIRSAPPSWLDRVGQLIRERGFVVHVSP
jgi:wyosine [tRNA(Phe)-imidazoG37] synthetase (radical SAM superfamily)